MKGLEEANNRFFLKAYGLEAELTPDVPIDQITLTVNPAYRYGKKLSDDEWSVEGGFPEELETRFREDTMRELVSYAVGCMMGRYSLDKPGLVLANSGDTVAAYDQAIADWRALLAQSPIDIDSVRLREDARSACDRCGTPVAALDARLVLARNAEGAVAGRPLLYCEPCAAEQKAALSKDIGLWGFDYAKAIREGWFTPETGAAFVAQAGCFDSAPAKPLPPPSGFAPDADAIIPITDTDWFDDDATHRLVEFIGKAWGSHDEEVASDEVVSDEDSITNHYPLSTSSSPLTTNHYPLSTSSSPLSTSSLEENLKFLADNLSPKRGESPRDTIRRYFADGFFKDHLKTYKKRPIYWCFTSGKQKAFQCLVYLHRYHEGTLARMRMEYVVPLQSKLAARIDTLADEIPTAASASRAKTLQKARDKLIKQLEELRRFDEQLRHYADQRIALDLDDGVKVNYAKFGDLLAEVKAVTGKSADE